MDIHHRRSPSSDRFLGLFSDSSRKHHSSTAGASAAAAEDSELHESDFLWTATAETDESNRSSRRKLGFRQNSGILTATAAATPARAIPKPQRELVTESAPSRKFRNSAPISVPPPPAAARRRLGELDGLSFVDDGDEEAEMMLPPHEMVAMKLKTTSHSVLEGAGRTLKGRDLRQVRNAVWRQTGFLD